MLDDVVANESVPAYEPPAHDETASDVEVQAKETDDKSPVDAKAEQPKVETPTKKPVPEGLKKERKNDWIQSRISHYAAETRAAREEAKKIREELEQIRSKQTGGKPSSRPGQPPNPDDFTQYSDYVDALVDWKVEQREMQSRAKAQERTVVDDYVTRRQAFDQESAKFASGYEDPEAVLEAMHRDDLPITPPMADAIMDLGAEGVAVLFSLSQNPIEAMRIANLPPRLAGLEIAKLSAKLSTEPAQTTQVEPAMPAQPVKPSPKVIPQVRGSSPELDEAPSDRDDVVTWAQKEAQRMRKLNPGIKTYVPIR